MSDVPLLSTGNGASLDVYYLRFREYGNAPGVCVNFMCPSRCMNSVRDWRREWIESPKDLNDIN